MPGLMNYLLRCSFVGSCDSIFPMFSSALTNSNCAWRRGAPQWHCVHRPTRSLKTPSVLRWHVQPLSKALPDNRSPIDCFVLVMLALGPTGVPMLKPENTNTIHSVIPDISIAPLQVIYYSEVLPTTALILCRS